MLAASAATAADFSVGIGAGAADGRVDCVASARCDRNGASWKLFGSYRIGEQVDMQAAYFHAGRFQGGDTSPLGTEFGGSFRVDGVGLTAGYRWAFAPRWSLVGRAGIASLHTRFEYADAAWGSVGKTTVQPLLGLALAYQISPAIGVGLDYDATRFKAHATRGPLHMFGATAQFSF